MPNVAVVVLGDVGRSPRMQYHCTSLAALPNTQVSLIGYRGERCIEQVEANAHIRQYLISTPFANLSRKWFLLYAPVKVLYQLFQLFWILLVTIPRPTAILVQNPPSIPALFAVWLAARCRGSRMVIDWHNFGFTVLAHSLGPSHIFVSIARWYERCFAGLADSHICVTNAMRLWLEQNWGIRPTVLYDKPPPFFRSATAAEKHSLFSRLAHQLPAAADYGQFATTHSPSSCSGGVSSAASTTTLFTRARSGSAASTADPGATSSDGRDTPTARQLSELSYEDLAGRPALIVSSTSWTEDEDFGILLEALIELDKEAVAKPSEYPNFLVVVTGKGPMRTFYEARMAELKLQRVQVRTLWLSTADYPLMLGSADLGVCLHVSTSGLDLPMKVVDMFGAGIPVCAVSFSCLNELVKHDVNGLVFHNPAQLAEQLKALFEGFPAAPSSQLLTRLRSGVAEFQLNRWQDNWDRSVRHMFVAR